MAIFLDEKLHQLVKKLADTKFSSKTGIYKSSWIVKEYKRRGGKFKGPKTENTDLKNWYKEKWVDLNRPIKFKGEIIGYESCGRINTKKISKYPLCRPTVKVSKDTPKLLSEIPKKNLSRAKKLKEKYKGSKNISFNNNSKSISQNLPFYMTGLGPGSQFYGKRSSIMVSVPKNVKKTALYAYKIRDLGFEGGIETGWKRAKQLSTQNEIPIEDLRFIRNWFARHIYTSYPSYKAWIKAGKPTTTEWKNKHGIIAWLIWAGDDGLDWINSKKVLKLLNSHYDKNYKPIKA
jgi:hypothetical protein